MRKLFDILLILLVILSVTGCKTDSAESDTFFPVVVSDQPVPAQTNVGALVLSRDPSRNEVAFMTSKNGVKLSVAPGLDLPPYLDVISINKQIDDEDIYFYLEVRGMPDLLVINNSGLSQVLEYCWYIGFDVDGNGSVTYNATFNHSRFKETGKEESMATIDSDAFETVVLQHKERSHYTVAPGDFEIDGNTMIFHMSKNGNKDLVRIKEDTPFCVLSEARTHDSHFVKLIPAN